MRELLYKSSFIRYYSALNSKRISYKSNGFWPMVIFGSLMFLGVIFPNTIYFLNSFIELFSIIALVLFLLAIGNGIRLNMTPNLAHTIPISHNKKTAWHMLCPLFAVAFGLLFFLLVCLTFYGIFCLSWFIRGVPVEAFVDELELYYLREIG
ncbi:MAG: hypothetical protein HDQ88_11755 [Clostridia bacterium]|nr:hypothetical protein [Clostridia bacterium]